MSDDYCAREGFRFLGADEIIRISTSDVNEADFIVRFGETTYLVEEKTKSDNPEQQRERSLSLAREGRHTLTLPIVHRNRMAGIIRKAVKQLDSSARFSHDFRVLWLTGAGSWAEVHYLQFVARLYGSAHIFDRDCDHLRLCYFFYDSDFYRHAETLDAAVAYENGDEVSAKLCLNPMSPRYEALRSSKLHAAFGGAVEDPRLDVDAFVLDSNAPRDDESRKLTYLQNKYDTKPLMTMNPAWLEMAATYPLG